MKRADVVVVGGGISGLNCARKLARQNADWMLVEASDGLGGRVRTDLWQGFRLDRGFQVLLEAYPETGATLNYARLDLRPLVPGARVRYGGRFFRVVDPRREPRSLLESVSAPIATWGDHARVGWLVARLMMKSKAEILAQVDVTTEEALRRLGFSPLFIESFLRPFFGGIFLDPELETSSNFFEFILKMFAQGAASIPALGMGDLPKQLSSSLDRSRIRLRSRVSRIGETFVELEGGERIEARHIVLAVEAPALESLAGGLLEPPRMNPSTTLYFATDEAPVEEAILMLNGNGVGVINSCLVPSIAAPELAPAGQHLVSVSSVGQTFDDEAELLVEVKRELEQWFGSAASRWEHLRTYRVAHALPAYTPALQGARFRRELPTWLTVCGDHLETPAIEGAMRSGRLAARRALTMLRAGARARARRLTREVA